MFHPLGLLLLLLCSSCWANPVPQDVSEYTHMTINHTHPAIECFQGTDNNLELINCPSGWCRVRAGYGTIAHLCDVHVLCEKSSDANGETGCVRDPMNPSLFTCCCHESKCNSCNSEETCFQDFHGEVTAH
uniref:Activin_recp domain-containing protein n=1 Tax=Steinernema glaseri TaxID=37863 RepID=A0A1I7Z597_9BILA